MTFKVNYYIIIVKKYDFREVPKIKHQSFNSIGNYSYNTMLYSDLSYPPHFHKNYEFIYVKHGSARINLGGTGFDVSEKGTVIIPPNVIHSFSVDRYSQIWIGVFSSDFIYLYAKKYGGKLFLPFFCEGYIDNYLNQSLFGADTNDIYLLKSALYALCSQCEKNAEFFSSSLNLEINTEILDYISENFSNDITLEETAGMFGYEPHYFSKLFHDLFSVNFKDMVNMLRFEKACALIEKTDDTMMNIAYESGFKSIRSFNRVFKALSGMTPREYLRERNIGRG